MQTLQRQHATECALPARERGKPESSAAPVQRVLMTADAVGGVFTFCVDLAAYLARQSVQVLMAVMGPSPTEAQRRLVRALPGVSLVAGDFPLEWMPDPWRGVDEAGAWLQELADAFVPDVVHLNQYSHGACRWNAPVVMTAHSCVMSWWRAVKQEEAPASWQTYADRVRRGLSGAHTVTAPSHAMCKELQRCYGPVPRARVIHNGRDAARFAPAAAKQPVVVGMGRLWDEAKNLTALDEAASGLAWDVCVVGPITAPDGHAVQATHARSLGTLASDEVAACLSRASIFCSPALYEPFGLAVLEAALSGCALVLADIPTFREIWGDAALFVDPRDPPAIRDGLARLISDQPLRTRMADAAVKRARLFAHRGWAESYLNLYEHAAPRRVAAKEA